MFDEEDVADVVAAVQQGDLDVVIEAVQSGLVDPAAVDADGCSLLHWAAVNNRFEICAFLLKPLVPNVKRAGSSITIRAADVNVIGGILGETPLAWAVRKGHTPIVALLLSHGADPNRKSVKNMSIMHLGCQAGSLQTL